MTKDRFIQPIPYEELQRRWDIAQAIMQAKELDALILQNSNDWLGGYVRWFTGVPANNAYPRSIVFFGPGNMKVVEQGPIGGVVEPDQTDPAWFGVREVRTFPSYTTAYYSVARDAELVADILSEAGVKRLGWVNPAGAYFGFGKALEELHGASLFIDVTNDIDLAKAVKSPVEQHLVRQTAALQDQVIASVAGFIKPGMRDFEVAAFAQYEAHRLGAEQGIFLSSSSPRGTAAVFRPPHLLGRRIGRGDVFALLVETNGPGGYYTEVARSFCLGRPEPELVVAVQAAVDAQARTLERLKPGVGCAEIAAAHDSYMVSRGYPQERRLYCHGQGYDMVERPLVRSDDEMLLLEGMNIVVHPGFITPAANALVCDNYLLTADGPEALHESSQKVWEI